MEGTVGVYQQLQAEVQNDIGVSIFVWIPMSGIGCTWKKSAYHWFRPASALWNRHMLRRAREKGYCTAIASCYPHDVASITRFVNSFYLRWRVRPGAIIVVHDRWHTAATLRKALPCILKSGMELGTLSDLQSAYDEEMDRKKR
eukprot:symbB.v1.2.019205.t1/scaffold1562.1/size111602/4